MRGNSGIAGISALGLVGGLILSACVAQAGAQNRAGEDRSQDQIERMRGRFDLTATPDTSYDQIERMRGRFDLTATPDTSYDQIERMRGGASSQ